MTTNTLKIKRKVVKEALNNHSPQQNAPENSEAIRKETSFRSEPTTRGKTVNASDEQIEDKTPKTSDGHSLKEDRGSNSKGCRIEWVIDGDSTRYICGNSYNTYLIKGKYLCPYCKKFRPKGEVLK